MVIGSVRQWSDPTGGRVEQVDLAAPIAVGLERQSGSEARRRAIPETPCLRPWLSPSNPARRRFAATDRRGFRNRAKT